jgi:hypothetical protein
VLSNKPAMDVPVFNISFFAEICAQSVIRKITYLNELDVRKPLVVSISHRSEELRLYNLV